MTRRARTDLRDRMQRVAAKPATHPDTPKRSRAASTRRPAAAARRRAPEPVELDDEPELEIDEDPEPGLEIRPTPTSRSRLETLVAWAQWELMSVPRERLHYLKRLLAGDGASRHDD
ncbi:MAG: hypothetical protein JOZ75_07485 [Candidatus Dormibacteraeota bacterium]|nr:hypothetical protein [Candidatus Dormibacteraeota bacterium]